MSRVDALILRVDDESKALWNEALTFSLNFPTSVRNNNSKKKKNSIMVQRAKWNFFLSGDWRRLSVSPAFICEKRSKFQDREQNFNIDQKPRRHNYLIIQWRNLPPLTSGYFVWVSAVFDCRLRTQLFFFLSSFFVVTPQGNFLQLVLVAAVKEAANVN